jgi:hypothetical protein
MKILRQYSGFNFTIWFKNINLKTLLGTNIITIIQNDIPNLAN